MGYSLRKGRPREEVHTGPRNEFRALGQGILVVSCTWILVQNREYGMQMDALKAH